MRRHQPAIFLLFYTISFCSLAGNPAGVLQPADQIEIIRDSAVFETSVEDMGIPLFNVKAYGAVGDGSTDDSSEVQDAIDDAASQGGAVYFPTSSGSYVVNGLTLNGTVNIHAPFATLENTGASSMFKLGNTSTLLNSRISIYQVKQGASAGHIFEVGSNGVVQCEISVQQIVLKSPGYSALYIDNDNFYFNRLRVGRLQTNVGYTFGNPVNMQSAGTRISANRFDMHELKNSGGSPDYFIYFKNTGGSPNRGNIFGSSNWENIDNGGIYLSGTSMTAIEGVTSYDNGENISAHLIYLADDGGFDTRQTIISNVTRTKGALAAGIKDIKLSSVAGFTTIMNSGGNSAGINFTVDAANLSSVVIQNRAYMNVENDTYAIYSGDIEHSGRHESGQAALDSGQVNVTFSSSQPNTNYSIKLSGNANETFYWSNKTTTGFTLYSSNTNSSADVDWTVSR